MNKIQSVSEITTWDGKHTLIVRFAKGANVSLINGALYVDDMAIEDYRRLIHGCQRAVAGPPMPAIEDAEFGNDAPFSQTVVLPSYGKG